MIAPFVLQSSSSNIITLTYILYCIIITLTYILYCIIKYFLRLWLMTSLIWLPIRINLFIMFILFCSVDNDLYSATVADMSGRDALIFKVPMRTEQYDSQWLNGMLMTIAIIVINLLSFCKINFYIIGWFYKINWCWINHMSTWIFEN